MLPAELADSPADRQVIEREVAMVPLVLAERFLLDQTPEADEVKLARLYLDQEQYILGRDLHVDVIVPILGAHFEQDIDSGAYSVVGIDEDLRLALSAEDNIPTSDLVTAAHATHALVIRDSTAVIGGHGFYFVVDPSPETKDLIDRFFEGAAIELPAGTTFVQVAARPLGWVGQFEVRRGGVYTHLLRDYPVRMDKAANIQSWLMVDPDQSERIAHDVQALAESHPSVRVAARRLVRSRDRDDDEDRIIDLCIGLEAMLGTGSGETVHRLSIRAAAILGPLGWGKSRAVYDLVRDVYSYRSRVVHGTPGPHKKDLLEVDGIPMHASRVAIAALCAILHIALSQPGFKPDHVDNDFIFGAFDRSAEGLTEN
ncbi:hypothetical protein GA0070561_4583 [Micromonospora saelicesensis]|uniref:Uncharacterized protein n=2 Tax=Micromonospora saelicesensis TaxID=285676 RepID=A0A1C4YTH0_9ACTN|nr:hypothetical protein GA0070561_4583 [Micromonospora saelicesensis]